MNSVANVSVGKPKVGGAIYRAPITNTLLLPTDASTALDAAFKNLGFISADGVTNSSGGSASNIKAWGGETVYTTHSDSADTFKFLAIEALNTEVLKAFYGDNNVTGALPTGITIDVNDDDPENFAWVIDMVLRDNVLKRVVLPNAAVTVRGDVVYRDNEIIGYPITLTAYPDSSGDTHHEYIVA